MYLEISHPMFWEVVKPERGQLYVQLMKLYVYKLYTIYTCVLRILSTVLYIFLDTWGSRKTPFFRQEYFFGYRFFIRIGILQLVLLIRICIYKLV
jgi:hypothetical protein